MVALGVRHQMSAPLYQALWIALRELPLETVERVMERAVLECEFMPTPLEFRRMAGVLPRPSVPYHHPWAEPRRALPSANQSGPPPGGFEAYLRELADQKSEGGNR